MSLESGQGLVMINTSASWGGNEHWAVQVATGMAARGARVLVVWSHDVVGDRVRANGLASRRLRLRADADLPAILELRQLLVRHRASAVVPTRWREYLHAGLASRLAGRPRVILRLGLDGRLREDLKRKLIFRLADRVLVNAPDIQRTLAGHGWIDPARVAVVLNGLDVDAWRPRWEPPARAAGQAFRQELGVDPDVPLLLAAGGFTAQKDFASLLTAMARLGERRPEARLLLVGDGPLRNQLLAQRAQLGLDRTVLMPGFRHDMSAAMAAANLFVLSSTNEGMARVLIEAAASGLPAVATDVSGTRLAVIDGQTGLVVPPQDPAALTAALDTLIGDRERRDEMGRAARALASRRFTDTRMFDEAATVFFGPGPV